MVPSRTSSGCNAISVSTSSIYLTRFMPAAFLVCILMVYNGRR